MDQARCANQSTLYADISGAVGFIAAAARNLPTSDVWCIMYPTVRSLLYADVLELDEMTIMAALLEPVRKIAGDSD